MANSTVSNHPHGGLEASPASRSTSFSALRVRILRIAHHQSALHSMSHVLDIPCANTVLSQITRALRSTLALAGFKAKNNVMTVPFRALEERVRAASPANPPQSFYPFGIPSTSNAMPNGTDKKRKASSSFTNTSSYYNSPLGYGASSSSTGAGLQSPYSSYPYASSSTQAYPGPSNATQSLFASILAPPPAKRARTIHNPEAPPVPAPLPPSQPASRSPKKGSSRKSNKEAAAAAAAASKGSEKASSKSRKPASKAKSKARNRANSVSSTRTRSSLGGDSTDAVNDTDIKAAATLTEILFSRTGTGTGTAMGSPRSSFSQASVSSARSGAGPGSQPTSGLGMGVGALPLSQSSSLSSLSTASAPAEINTRAHARTNSATSVGSIRAAEQQILAAAVDAMDVDGLRRRSMTPTATSRGSMSLPSSQSQDQQSQSQPANAPTRAVDTEAADLMLLLANSPSPARPSVPRDKDITRGVFAAGRVLFPSVGDGGKEKEKDGGGLGSPPLSQSAPVAARSPPRAAADPIVTPPTPRSADASPTSSQRTEVMSASSQSQGRGRGQKADIEMSLGLLPAPPSPSRIPVGPQTPAAFDMNDYINVSPSPAIQAVTRSSSAALSSSLSFSSLASSQTHSHHAPSSQPTSSQTQPQYQSQPPSSSQSTLVSHSQTQTHLGTPGRFRASGVVGVSSPLRKSVDAAGLGVGVGMGVGIGAGRRLFENEATAGVGVGTRSSAGPLGSGIDLVRT